MILHGVRSAPALNVPGIDGLRAFAALSVLAAHLGLGVESQFGRESLGSTIRTALLFGVHGVQLFFVISGFLLSLPYLSALVGHGTMPGFRRYVIGRLVRILPAFWVALLFFFIVTRSYFRGLEAAIWDLLLLQNYVPTAGRSLAVAWTLGVEAQFYVALPLILMAISALSRVCRTWWQRAVIAATVVVALVELAPAGQAMAQDALLQAGVERSWVGEVVPYLLPLSFPFFGLGMLLALVYVVASRWDLPGTVAPAPLYLTAIGLLVLAVSGWGGAALSWTATAWPVALVGSVAFAAGRSVFRSRVMTWLGLVSYGIYLYHDPLIEKITALQLWVGPAAPMLPLNFMIAAGITLVFASASYYLVERPALTLKAVWASNGRMRVLGQRPTGLARPGAPARTADSPLEGGDATPVGGPPSGMGGS